LTNLWFDIKIALKAGIRMLHLTAEPVSVADVVQQGFGVPFDQSLPNPPAIYDMQSRYADIFGAQGHYQYSARETIQAIRTYAQSEPLTIKSDSKESL